jgi:hypothetical protein
MTLKEKIMKLQTYKMFMGEDTVYVERDDVLKLLEQERVEKCQWIKYDHRTMCPKEHDVDNPYWRIPDNMSALKYCPYCGKKIEVKL